MSQKKQTHLKRCAQQRMARPTRIKGATLIELMVGIAIGLLTVAVGLGALLVSRGISGTVSEASSLQQQAAYAFRVMGQQIRQAGGLELNLNPNFAAIATAGTSAALTPVAFDAPDPAGVRPSFDRAKSTVQGKDNPSSTEYALTVGYQNYQETIHPIPPATTASAQYQLRDCLGENPVATAAAVVQSSFKLAAGELVCAGIGGKAQAVIQNVTGMSVSYLLQDPAAALTGLPTIKYTDAAGVAASARGWADVYAVEVCLELTGTEVIDSVKTKYTQCDGTSADRGNRLRMVFKNTFQIRSQGRPSV